MKKITSPYALKRNSRIHGSGIFAKKNISKGTKVIEYVGEKITKAVSRDRGHELLEKHKKNKKYGAVYLFELNKKQDIDGDVPYNTAKYINHACNPNCEAYLSRGHIWIISLKEIKKGDEITYNYGYDFEDYKHHKCYCRSHNCIGYILAKEHWPKLKKLKARKRKK